VLAALGALSVPCVAAFGQLSIPWWTFDGGGGTSAGGVFTLTGTAAQCDAGVPMTGGGFTMTGGFWVVATGACTADLGVQGGVEGQDGVLDNNDFVVFISLFFNHDPRADFGAQGGVAGSDGSFDNNDFVVFIDRFFAGCGA
jgi:hypothetical protein